jgi:NAD(P)H-dependent flavin oxidoreductase YrpB (nitropropane dioxygenase family)
VLRTRFTDLLGVEHPIVLGGMSSGTNVELVAAVSQAGGLGILGVTGRSPEQIREAADAIRARTTRPFGLNLLLFMVGSRIDPAAVEAAIGSGARVLSTAWGDPAPYVSSAHAAGQIVMHMVATAEDARHAVDAGVDVVVAQGTEGGGHVGLVSTMALVPAVLDVAGGVPVLAAGGIADGRGLAAALAMGADGVLMGTRFLATREAPVPASYKQAIVDASGSDTVISQVPDLAPVVEWPGALSRVIRNRFVDEWLGREDELRQQGADVGRRAEAARAADDRDGMKLFAGQSSGLIASVESAGDVVARISADAERLLRERVPRILTSSAGERR